MQTCLEKRGIPARASALTRNDYNVNDPYSERHPDALSTGDPQGKGTGSGGHTHSVPNCNLPISLMDYSNFDTSNNAGGLYDIEGRNEIGGRNRLVAINIYNEENEYGANLVDSSLNIADGQVVI